MTQQVEQAGIHAVRRGGGLHKYVDDKTLSGSLQVLTDATLYYNIPAGKQVVICMMHLDIETFSDDVSFEMVSCDAVAGGGTPTKLCGHAHLFVGANANPSASHEREFIPPMVVKYSSGARSVTMRVNANDSSAVASCGWMAWVEKEV